MYDLCNGGDCDLVTVSAKDGGDPAHLLGNDSEFRLDPGGWQPIPSSTSTPETEPPPQAQPRPGEGPAPAARPDLPVPVGRGPSTVVVTPPSRRGQRTVTRPQAMSRTAVALRRMYRKRFEVRSRYRVRCHRNVATTWTCRVSWRHGHQRYRGRVVVSLKPRNGYSITVRVRPRP
jgi:hypothetical protein